MLCPLYNHQESGIEDLAYRLAVSCQDATTSTGRCVANAFSINSLSSIWHVLTANAIGVSKCLLPIRHYLAPLLKLHLGHNGCILNGLVCRLLPKAQCDRRANRQVMARHTRRIYHQKTNIEPLGLTCSATCAARSFLLLPYEIAHVVSQRLASPRAPDSNVSQYVEPRSGVQSYLWSTFILSASADDSYQTNPRRLCTNRHQILLGFFIGKLHCHHTSCLSNSRFQVNTLADQHDNFLRMAPANC
jgi:hypothetical protein